MSRRVPTQLIVGLVILLAGGGFVGTEYVLVKWYPRHEQHVAEETLRMKSYSNPSLGIEIQIASGIFGKVEVFPGGVRIYKTKFWSVDPSLTITSQPNPDNAAEFSQQILAKWETQGVYQEIPRYHFDHTKINNRDAVLIWQLKDRSMLLTARVISPERLIEADCTPGGEDEELYLQACEASLRTLKIAGPEPAPSKPPALEEVATPSGPGTKPD